MCHMSTVIEGSVLETPNRIDGTMEPSDKAFTANSELACHSFVKNIFIIIYYTTCFKVKIWLDHFGL